ncbi:MAG: VTT domain-containing protein [Anaerolineales bacterium]|uniref:VTT domain-containing protein n=1 Tax=Candidatus Desulfolinea nitratireducens TaxID=2841698 RepID=A0A8J6NHK1_9CHLR|nr:VTT domain-containing protein [Candidatus Desulfolinea nitratireducens]MBL6960421.1 VTT domain-containing protein [Anaerolineales bacterium]
MSKERRLTLFRWLSIIAVIALSAFIFSVRDQAEQLASYGYPGIFLISLLSNATVLLPAPGLAVVFTMGSIFHPFGVALAAGTGGAIGELSGFMAGFSGQAVVERMDIYERIIAWVEKYGTFAILIFAAVPNPFFDLAGIAAGATKIPIKNFLLACWIGQIIKALIFAYAGATSIGWILS